jgi:hypothetical protein
MRVQWNEGAVCEGERNVEHLRDSSRARILLLTPTPPDLNNPSHDNSTPSRSLALTAAQIRQILSPCFLLASESFALTIHRAGGLETYKVEVVAETTARFIIDRYIFKINKE